MRALRGGVPDGGRCGGRRLRSMDASRKRELLAYLVDRLTRERTGRAAPTDGFVAQLVRRAQGRDAAAKDAWLAFRALANVREPWPADESLLAAQDELLQGVIAEAGVTRFDDLAPAPADGRLRLWQGDITTLDADAVVNAANAGMTGCWAPLHYCVDNAIHTFSGMQLRLECARLMAAQGHPEPTAQAKVTGAYNLPARCVIHTVGPSPMGIRPRRTASSSHAATRRASMRRRARSCAASRSAASRRACSAFRRPRPRASPCALFAAGSTRIPIPASRWRSTRSSTKTRASIARCSGCSASARPRSRAYSVRPRSPAARPTGCALGARRLARPTSCAWRSSARASAPRAWFAVLSAS